MKYLVAAALLIAAPANAQSWDVGPVTPTWSSTVQWAPPIDPADPHPADEFEPPVSEHDDVLYDREAWYVSSTGRTGVGTSLEAKFRTHCKPTFIKKADPILARGLYPAAHDHTFFGPTDPYIIENVENFDYDMAREYPGSSCHGGPINTTLYWEPSAKRDMPTGLSLTIIPENAGFYYTHQSVDAPDSVSIRRNYRFIGGVNPMNFNDTAKRKEYADAGLMYPGSPVQSAGFLGIQCKPGNYDGSADSAPVLADHAWQRPDGYPESRIARYMKGPNGEDPWDGACTAGMILVTNAAQDCWDGTNLSSPNGRDHVRYSTRQADGLVQRQCPSNYVKVMHFQAGVTFFHEGWDKDLQHWYLSSDRLDPAMTLTQDIDPETDLPCALDPETQGDPCSLDPCRQTGPYFCSFSTAHFDWWHGWDDFIMSQWEHNCGGIAMGEEPGEVADCQPTVFMGEGPTSVGLIGSGTPPEADLSTNPVHSMPTERFSSSEQGQRYFPIRPSDLSQGPITIHVGH